MIGVDITRIDRFNIDNTTFVKKILSQRELTEFNESSKKQLFLAARWSIKEAIFKADNSYSNFQDITIERKNKIYKFKDFVITTSKEDNYYISFVYKKGAK